MGVADVGQDPELSTEVLERGCRVNRTASPLLLEQLDCHGLAIIAPTVDLQMVMGIS